jgi:pyruvate ferredoxin oxidoreductase beta subunit
MEPTFKLCRAGSFAAAARARAENERSSPRDRAGGEPLPPRCTGCGEALAARHVVGAAMSATGCNVIAVDAMDCLVAYAMPGSADRADVPRIRALAGNAAAVAAGVAAGARVKGRAEIRVLAQVCGVASGGVGFGCLSAMFERDDDVLYVCYDDEPFLNAEQARAAPARRPPAPAGEARTAAGAGKCLPLIALAHGIPYVATASVADPGDLERKVARAIRVRGARYVHVHAPCPPAWGAPAGDTIAVAQLAVDTGLFPLFEGERGEVTACTRIAHRLPVAACLEPRSPGAELFGAIPDAGRLAAFQAAADRNVLRFGLAG